MTVLTAPWDARAEQTVRGPHRLVWRVELIAPVPPEYIPTVVGVLAAESVEVSMDEGWSPFVQGSAVVTTPPVEVAQYLEPRTGTSRVRVSVGYIHPGDNAKDADVHPVAYLGIREADEDVAAGTTALSLASDEALAQELAVWTGALYDQEIIADRVAAMLTDAQLGTLSVDPAVADLTAPEAWEAVLGESWWDALSRHMDEHGLWLRCDPLGGWWLGPRPALGSQAVHPLRVGARGTLTDAHAITSRDESGSGGGWASHVMVIYRWTDDLDVEHRAIGRAGAAGTWAPGVPSVTPGPGARTYVETREGIASAEVAAAVAEALVARTASRGRRWAVSAVAAPWLRPGHTVTIDTATNPQERVLVTRTALRLPEGSMTVETRSPGSVLTTSTGEAT